MENSFANVHAFDGKLKNNFIKQEFSFSEKRQKFEQLITQLSNSDAIEMVNLIIAALDDGSNLNYDATNDIDASDVLISICNKDISDLLDFMDEQLGDNYRLGQCSQGRTIRLLQIWKALN